MIIYNVTINIENQVHDDWLEWMKSIHIPDVMRTGIFSEYKMLKVLNDDQSGGQTYSVQYSCATMERFKQYEDIYAPILRNEVIKRYGNKFIAFRTLLESVD
jgi:hypothetical protein